MHQILLEIDLSKDTKIVSKIGDYCINYFHQNSIGTVIKHILGHGLAKVDSHHYTPIVNKKIDYLIRKDLQPLEIKCRNDGTYYF